MDTQPTMTDVMAVTPEQLTTMTPPEIDALNAVLGGEYARLDSKAEAAWEGLYGALLMDKVQDRYNSKRRVWPVNFAEAETLAQQHIDEGTEPSPKAALMHRIRTVEQYADGLRTALGRLESVRNEVHVLNQGPYKTLTGEWTRRGGWSRFFLVPDGHIHEGRQCFTLRPTTQLAWQPELSGQTEAEAVAKLGPYLCTHCFASAPLDWKKDPAEANRKPECPMSRKDATPYMDARMKRRNSKFADCPTCGENISVTSGWKFRTHPPKKTADQ